MGHIINNAQGKKYTNSLEATAVFTDYPGKTGVRVMGGTPYDRIEGQGYIDRDNVYDPCVSSVQAELHSRTQFTDGNTANEEWADLFANYVSGNFDGSDIGQAKLNWVRDQLNIG